MNSSMILQTAVPSGSIDAYIQTVNRVPILSAEDEQQLARRLHEQNDLEAARLLVMAHLRFVIRVAKGYNGYGLSQSDLIQEGTIGLMKAVKRFDPNVGVRLVSFAVHWIRAEMHEFILRNWRIVKVATTKAQRKLFFNLRSSKKRLGWMNHEEVQAVAKDLGVSTKDVLEMEKRMSAYDASFDGANSSDDDRSEMTNPSAYLVNSRIGPEQELETEQDILLKQNKLNDALKKLDERSREIIQTRWLSENKATLHELAKKYHVSAERIRQIEQNAMKKLQASFVAE